MSANPSLAAHPRVEDWLTVRPDGFVEVRTGKVEIGQRIATALALVAARELGVPYERIVMASPKTGLSPDEGYTSGSNSMEHSGHALRLAAATARRELVARAARRLDVDPETLEVHEGLVRSRATNQTLSIEALVGDAPLALPIDPDAPPRPGTTKETLRTARIEPLHLRAIVTGKHDFVHDLRFADMLHARVVRPPHYHSVLEALPAGRGFCATGASSRWRTRTSIGRTGPRRASPPWSSGVRHARWTSGRSRNRSSAIGARAFRCANAGRTGSPSPPCLPMPRGSCARATSGPT